MTMFPALLGALLAASPAGAADSAPEPVSHQILVHVDPRLELLGVVQMLAAQSAPPHGFALHPRNPYVAALKKRFSDAAQDDVVKREAALPAFFDFLHRGDLLMRLGPLPDLQPKLFIPGAMAFQAGGQAALDGWLGALRDFSKRRDFAAAVAEQKPLIEPAVDAFRQSVIKNDYLRKIERYTGLPFVGRYEVSLSPFFLAGSMDNVVYMADDGSYDIRTVIGAQETPGGLDFLPDRYPTTVWHELSHGLLDTMADLNEDEIMERGGPNGRNKPAGCYGDWLQCVKEQVVRAVMIRLVTINMGEAAGKRVLQEEGTVRFPALADMVEKLKIYEKERDKYPTLVEFYPELLKTLPPPDPALARGSETAQVKPEEVSGPGDPGPNWVINSVWPFASEGQRARALRYLNIPRALDADLLRKRAALRLMAGDSDGAASDAKAALAQRPNDAGAALLRASALMRLDAGGAADALAQLRSICSGSGVLDALACRNGARLALGNETAAGYSAPPSPEAQVGALPPARDDVQVTYAVDPRLELLSGAVMLADPQRWQDRFGQARSKYIADAKALFAPLASHPAVALVASRLKAGVDPGILAQEALSMREDLSGPAAAPAVVGGDADAAQLADQLRDFAARSHFLDFERAHQSDLDAFVREARDEGRRQLPASAVLDYLRSAPRKYRFVLAPMLPQEYQVNIPCEQPGTTCVRVRSGLPWKGGRIGFDFESFGACAGHEVTHTVTDALAEAHADELEAYAGLMTPGCTDSWHGCVLEYTVFAVDLRVVDRLFGDDLHRRLLDETTRRGFPYLSAVDERLKEFESHPERYPTFESFYPRLVSLYRELLEKRFAEQAKQPITVSGAVAGAERLRPAIGIDARVELAAAVARLARGLPVDPAWGESEAAKLQSLSEDPAVVSARRLWQDRDIGGLAELAVFVSEPPKLELEAPLPLGLARQLGGADAARALVGQLRDFAARADFAAAFERARPALLAEARPSLERLKAAKPAALASFLGLPRLDRKFVVSPSWPEREARRAPLAEGQLEYWIGDSADDLLYSFVGLAMPSAPADATGGLAAACSSAQAPTWPLCVREHVIEGVLLSRTGLGPEESRRRLTADEARGFPFLGRLYADLGRLLSSGSGDLPELYPSLSRDMATWTFPSPPVEAWPAETDEQPTLVVSTRSAAGPAELVFSIDARTELYSALLLASAKDFPAADPYQKEARDLVMRSDPQKAEAALAGLERRRAGLAAQLLSFLNDPPKLSVDRSIPVNFIAEAGGRRAVSDFFEAARDFARRSDFAGFFSSHRPEYERLVETAARESGRALPLQAAGRYLGHPFQGRYDFELLPLYPQPAQTFSIVDPDGREIRLRSASAGLDGLSFGLDSFGDSTTHELIHTVTNPLVPQVAGGRTPAGCNDSNGAGSWTSCFQEHLVYAVSVRVAAQVLGEPAAQQLLERYVGAGFPDLPQLCAQLKIYERQRSRFPRLADFYPRLEATFRNELPESGSVLAARRAKDDGVRAFGEGRYAAALSYFDTAASLEPSDAEAQLDRGVALEAAGRLDEALSAYDSAVRLGSPSDWEHLVAALSSRATLYEHRGRRQDAASDLDRALRLAPKDWSGREDLSARFDALQGAGK